MTASLDVGSPAPDFDLPADGGGRASLSARRGRPVVVYFYPKDDTPGCTTEAKDFSAMADRFAAAGATVIGISKDSPASHDRFKAKHSLALTLASDEEGSVVEAYGAWVEKSMYGKKYMGVDRSTFLIGPDGVIRRTWRKVKVAGHAAEVLAAVEALGAT